MKNLDNSREYQIKEIKEGNNKKYIYSFELKNPHIESFFDMKDEQINYYNSWQNKGIIENISNFIKNKENIKISNGNLEIYFDDYNKEQINLINESIRDFYEEKEMHITRMFGSYILLQKIKGELKAVEATNIPIKYCPLMIKLLKEVSGDYASELIKSLEENNQEQQKINMCKLINETVIKSGYFDTNRPLNSCEANVLFGASETMFSAFKNNLIDAAVIVSNNLGTIITTNEENTQGAVKRMTGLFYTTTSKNIIETAKKEGITPVYPYTGKIDQLEGVKEAIRMGYKKIAVSVAANDNYLHKELKELEKDGIEIYKFGLCSTGIKKQTAEIMKDNADVVWSCASKYVKELIEPNAIAQVGIKIPVHIMTERGWLIISNHLMEIYKDVDIKNLKLQKGEEKTIFLNEKGKIKTLKKQQLKKCIDCPNPCV